MPYDQESGLLCLEREECRL